MYIETPNEKFKGAELVKCFLKAKVKVNSQDSSSCFTFFPYSLKWKPSQLAQALSSLKLLFPAFYPQILNFRHCITQQHILTELKQYFSR